MTGWRVTYMMGGMLYFKDIMTSDLYGVLSVCGVWSGDILKIEKIAMVQP